MREIDDPLWVRVLALALVVAVAAYGAVGLLLAIAGWYHPALVFGVGTLVLVALGWLSRSLVPRRGTVSGLAHVCAVAAVAAVVAITVWNVSNADQHVFVNRDGATYLDTGRWIASHGNLRVEPFVGPFASSTALTFGSAGMNQQGHHLDFTLAHMLPALLAEAHNIGGDRFMFATVPFLGGVALLGFYLLSRRVLRSPLLALAAMLCLAFLMPEISFSRDSTTEIPIQLLLFGALWMLCDARVFLRRGPAFTAGFLLGIIEAVHIDGFMFLVGLPFVLLYAFVRADAEERRRARVPILFCVLGAALGASVGVIDLTLRSIGYLHSLRSNFDRLAAAVVVAAVASIALVVVARTLRARAGVVSRLERTRPTVGFFAWVLVLAAGFGAWLVRPHIQTVHGQAQIVVKVVQQLDRLPVDPTRRYYELSMRWMDWYLGPITLTLAIIGAAYATRAFVRGRLGRAPAITALIIGPPTVLYLWRPSIVPDQIWVMRRFLPATFPILILAALGVLSAVLRRDFGGWNVITRGLASVLVVAAVAFPIYTIRNVSQMTEQRGMLTVVKQACAIIGPNGAVVLPEDDAPGGTTWLYGPQTLRSFCDVPVAVMPSGQASRLLSRKQAGALDPNALRVMALEWSRAGRTLYVVSDHPGQIGIMFPGTRATLIGPVANPHRLIQSLVGRPNGYHTERQQLAVAPVPMPLAPPVP